MFSKCFIFVGVFAMALSAAKANTLLQQLQRMPSDGLRRLYGQANIASNDSRNCLRECDGQTKVCYFEFKVENFYAMGGPCGNCAKGNINDCFAKECVTMNGVERNVMTINHQIPGTGINVCLGDRVVVDVVNQMAGAGVAIHWHGLHQVDTPWSDGVPMVTQCPVHEANSFRYNFVATEVGTHYWHCHTGVHRMNGCFGKLVVRDTQANDPHSARYDYDLEEHEVLITDWTNALAEDYLPGKPSSLLGVDSFLINGQGTYHNESAGTRTFAPMAAFYVQRGKRYRWRVGNVGNQHYPVEFCIEGHQLTIIAADGAPVEPLVVDCFISHTGERYDFVLDTLTDPDISEVFIRLRAVPVPGAADRLRDMARLIIVDDINQTIRSNADHLPVLDDRAYYTPYTNDSTLNHPDTICGTPGSYCVPDLVPIPNAQYESLRNVHNTEYVAQIPVTYGLLVGTTHPSHFLTYHDRTITVFMNNIGTTLSPVPGLTQDDSHVKYCNVDQLPSNCNGTSLCYCPHLTELETNRAYDIIFIDRPIPNEVAYSHPIHFHGYYTQFLEVGHGDDYKTGNPVYRNLTRNAPLKDTIMIPGGGYAIVRLRAINPGYWLMHCHIEQHMHLGMRMILKVGKKYEMVPPPEYFPTCGNFPPSA